uniref:Na+/proline symporter n=1 Tax=Candidatus Kentrum sp. DK TaxID=2126562 RepID=A0A450TC66_9GAMM|nr:MAG: Na+/proline symporter [Candidatus Kentron sp. DK]
MNFTYETFGLLAYLAIIAYVIYSLYRSSDEEKTARMTAKGSALGTRRFGVFGLASMLAITMVGPADFLALSQNGFNYGVLWSIFPLGAALALLVSGLFVVKRLEAKLFTGVKTTGEIFGRSTGRSSQFIVGLVVTIQTIAFSGVLIIAGGQVLEVFIGIDKHLGMVLTSLVVGFYTSYAGMDGVTRTDLVQRYIIAFILLVISLSVLSLLFSVDTSNVELFEKDDFDTDFPLKTILAYFSAYFFGELMLPTYTQRVFIANTSNTAKKGFLWGAAFLATWYIVITFSGSLAEAIPSLRTSMHDDRMVVLDLARYHFDDGTVLWGIMGAFIFAGLLALIHSTYDSFLNVGSSSFANDVIGVFNDDDKLLYQTTRQMSIAISALGLIVAIWFDNIIDALIFGYTIWVPSLLAPLLYILLVSKNNKLDSRVFWFSFVAGSTTWLLLEYVIKTDGWVSFIPSIVWGLVINATCLHVGTRVIATLNEDAQYE